MDTMKKKSMSGFRFLLFAAFSLGSALPGRAAEPRAAEILERLAAGFRAMAAYEVTFAVAAGDYAAAGRYDVAGESYYLALGDAEVFGDGAVRYEVDNRRREVTVSGMEAGSRNILNDPVHAFDFLDSTYAAALAWERDGRAAVTLTPASQEAVASGTVTVTVSTATMRPESLAYEYDGERVVISVTGIAPLETPLPAFDRAKYAGYEFIDFR